MKKPTKQLIFVLMCLAVAYPAKAYAAGDIHELTGQELYHWCAGSKEEQLLCHMWILGFKWGMAYSQMLAEDIKHVTPTTCFPHNLSGEQAGLIVDKWIRDHPEDLHLPAPAIAGTALDLAFPCKK